MAGAQRDGLLRIGEVAARAGVSADTVRYYERLGLLRPPARSESGYRLYSEVELRRLQFIRRAKRNATGWSSVGRMSLPAAARTSRRPVTVCLQNRRG
ncbi:MAG: hypothetical protein C4316_06395 [Chloroflexota bacterium]